MPRAEVDRLLEFLPIFEAPDFRAAEWPAQEEKIVDGVRHLQMPYPIYSDVVDRFIGAIGAAASSIDPYASLPEDETPDGVQFNVLGTSYPLEWFETATQNQVLRYLRLCVRGERFCDGHIDAEFLNGSILAALKRLKTLSRE